MQIWTLQKKTIIMKMYPQLCKGEQEWDVLIHDEAGRKDLQNEYVRFYVVYLKARADEIHQSCLYHRHPANDKIQNTVGTE